MRGFAISGEEKKGGKTFFRTFGLEINVTITILFSLLPIQQKKKKSYRKMM